MKKGFTLLEILLVIAAIGILAAIVIVAINPNRQLAQARDAQRESDVRTLHKALEQYLIDNGQYPTSVDQDYNEVCNTGGSGVGQGSVNPGCVDLRALVPTYLAAIPVDTNTDSSETGYYVWINQTNNKIAIANASSETKDYVGINFQGSTVSGGLAGELDINNYPGSGATWTDNSGNGLNASIVGATYNAITPGYFNLDGSNDRLDFGMASQLYTAYDTEFTMQFAVRLLSHNDPARTLFGIDDWARMNLLLADDEIIFEIGYSTPVDRLTYSTPFIFGEWNVITVVWDKLNRQEIYINGSLAASRTPTVNTYSGVQGTYGSANIGRGHTSPYSTYLNADINQFLFYNRALSQEEVKQNYQSIKERFN